MALLFLLNTRTNSVYNLLKYTENTYSYFKERILSAISSVYNQSFQKIGGYGRYIQIDKMAFKRGQLVRNPTSENDRNIIWIVGAIEEQTPNEIDQNLKQNFFWLSFQIDRPIR